MFIPQIPRPAHVALHLASLPVNTTTISEPSSWWLQGSLWLCGHSQVPCHFESIQVMALLFALIAAILVSVSFFFFFREDKEEQITPLCPQLVVKDTSLLFSIPFDKEDTDETMPVLDTQGKPMFKATIEYPDPSLLATSSVAASARVYSAKDDVTLATIVVRNGPMALQALAICRAASSGGDIFGYLEPDAAHRYMVRHRTGVPMLSLEGDFDKMNIRVLNAVNAEVCRLIGSTKVGGYHGFVAQHADAGLILSCLFATQVHRRMSDPLLARPCGSWPPDPAPFLGGLPPPSPMTSTCSPEDSDSDRTTAHIHEDATTIEQNALDVGGAAVTVKQICQAPPPAEHSEQQASGPLPACTGGESEESDRRQQQSGDSHGTGEQDAPPLTSQTPHKEGPSRVPALRLASLPGMLSDAQGVHQDEATVTTPRATIFDPTDPPEGRVGTPSIDDPQGGCCGISQSAEIPATVCNHKQSSQ